MTLDSLDGGPHGSECWRGGLLKEGGKGKGAFISRSNRYITISENPKSVVFPDLGCNTTT